MMPPKGKRRSNALVSRDAFELLRLVDGEGMLIDDAMKQLKLSRSRAYELLGRARSAVLRPKNEANKKAAETNVKRWYEAEPETPIESATVATTATLPDVQPTPRPVEPAPKAKSVRKVQPYTPEPKPVRNPNEDEATWRVRWRRWQVETQIAENMMQGAITGVVLRGRPHRGLCFGSCPIGRCTCHDPIGDF